MIQVKCDKCKEDVVETASKGGRGQGWETHYIFSLLGKDRNYTLCEKCEKLFFEWAGIDR